MRRQEILDRCVDCFAVKGFHQTSMRALSAELGMSLGGLYTYFRSKDDIIRAFVDRNRGEARALFEAVSPEMSFHEAIHTMGEMKVKSMSQTDEIKSCAVWIQINAEAVLNPKVRKLVREFYAYAEGKLTEMIKSAQMRGELSTDFDASNLARLFIYFGDGFDIGRLVSKGNRDAGEIVGLFFRLVRSGAGKNHSLGGKQNSQ